MENEIVKQEAKALAVAVGADDFQPMDQDSIRLPRLILAQGGNNNPLIREGVAKEGDLINSLSRDNYGKEIEIVPLIQLPSSRIKWLPREDGGGIACIARDGKHGHGDPGDTLKDNECTECPFFHDRDSKTGCSSNYQILALARGTKEPIMLTGDMIKPSDRGIKDMLSMALIAFQSKGLRMFQRSYTLKSTPAQTKQYNYFKLMCWPGNNNQPLPAEEVALFEQQYSYFKGSKVEAATEEGSEGAPKDW